MINFFIGFIVGVVAHALLLLFINRIEDDDYNPNGDLEG